MSVLNTFSPKGVFNKLAEIFGMRKTIVALGVGGSLAFAGMTAVFIVYPDDPNIVETVQSVTENIIEKENV